MASLGSLGSIDLTGDLTGAGKATLTKQIKSSDQVRTPSLNFDAYDSWAANAGTKEFDSTGGGASIVNDNVDYKCLMILGNRSAGGVRIVKVWDNFIASGTITGSKVYNAVYNDIAELFACNNPKDLEPGDIVIMTKGKVEKPHYDSDKRVVGVVSDTYGYLLGGEIRDNIDDYGNYVPLGLTGRVRVKLEGTCNEGDLLTCTKEGKARAVKFFDNSLHGCVIGKALEDEPADDGRIWMLIMNK